MKISMSFGYVLFSVLGAPAMVLGRILHSNTLANAWNRAATAFSHSWAGTVHQKQMKEALVETGACAWTQVQHSEFSVAMACKQAWVAGNLIDVYLMADRIERVLKVPTTPLAWQRATEGTAFARVPLKALSFEAMERAGVLPTLDGAIAMTRSEVEAGKATRAFKKQDDLRKASMAATQDLYENKGEAFPEPQSAESGTPVESATGIVTYANKNMIRPKNKAPYETFSVVLKQDETGQAVTFSGVDLKAKFESGEFTLGEHVRIDKFKVVFSSEMGGVTRVNTKNEYKVSKLTNAQ
ncbi:MAG: hypothetical protein K0M67_22640 [Thiobacillus sp.]|nr:hypothetical protein [Thiobacillus sp.]